MVLELRLVDEERECAEAVLPAVELGAARFVAHGGDVLGPQLLGDPMHLRVRHELLGRPGVELHLAPGASLLIGRLTMLVYALEM